MSFSDLSGSVQSMLPVLEKT